MCFSLGVAQRTEVDLNKKWKDLKSADLKSLRDQKNTGGRPPPYADIILDVIGEGTDVATVIDGE